jgi:hypothetical protein
MKQKWHLLYSTRNLPEANIIKGMLEQNNVPAVIVNKQDSSYLNFGEIELYVPESLKVVAADLLHRSQID